MHADDLDDYYADFDDDDVDDDADDESDDDANGQRILHCHYLDAAAVVVVGLL